MQIANILLDNPFGDKLTCFGKTFVAAFYELFYRHIKYFKRNIGILSIGVYHILNSAQRGISGINKHIGIALKQG